MLFDGSVPILLLADNSWYSQELRCGLLQADQEIDDNTENNLGNERDGDVDQGQRETLDERMVHRRARLPVDDRPLGEESRDFRHSRQSREQKREEQDTAPREEGLRRVLEPQEDRTDDDGLDDERHELDHLCGDASADDLHPPTHERAGLHGDGDDVGTLLVRVLRVLVLDALPVMVNALRLADELVVVCGHVLAAQAVDF